MLCFSVQRVVLPVNGADSRRFSGIRGLHFLTMTSSLNVSLLFFFHTNVLLDPFQTDAASNVSR